MKKKNKKKNKKKKEEKLLQGPVLEATELKCGLRLCLEFQFESSSVMFAFSDGSVSKE